MIRLVATAGLAVALTAPAAAQAPGWAALEKEAAATLQRYVRIIPQDAIAPAIQVIFDTLRATAGR